MTDLRAAEPTAVGSNLAARYWTSSGPVLLTGASLHHALG